MADRGLWLDEQSPPLVGAWLILHCSTTVGANSVWTSARSELATFGTNSIRDWFLSELGLTHGARSGSLVSDPFPSARQLQINCNLMSDVASHKKAIIIFS